MLSTCLVVAIALAPGSSRASIEFAADTLETVEKNVSEGDAVLVDVRSPEEWKMGHIEGSILLPVNSLRKHSFDAKKVANTLPPKKEGKILYTFCVVGMRAKQAGIILQQQGYIVRVLKPGYEELIEAGFKRADDENTRQRHAR